MPARPGQFRPPAARQAPRRFCRDPRPLSRAILQPGPDRTHRRSGAWWPGFRERRSRRFLTPGAPARGSAIRLAPLPAASPGQDPTPPTASRQPPHHRCASKRSRLPRRNPTVSPAATGATTGPQDRRWRSRSDHPIGPCKPARDVPRRGSPRPVPAGPTPASIDHNGHGCRGHRRARRRHEIAHPQPPGARTGVGSALVFPTSARPRR